MEFDEILADRDTFAGDGNEDVLCIGAGHRRHLIARPTTMRWWSAGLVLVVGIVLGHVAFGSGTSTPMATTSRPWTTHNEQGCPSGRSCRTHDVAAPLLVQLLRSDFPDLRASSLVATDDSETAQRYQLRLEAILARGLTLQIAAQDAPGEPPASTEWTAARDHAEQTISASGVVVHIVLARYNAQRPGVSDFRCEWCQRPRSGAWADLNPVLAQAQTRMWAMIGSGIESAAHSEPFA